ncbi:MAG: hypothetical protein U9N49_08715 [Campylobacterota bacterium]|nr:hypothetical protein [Campylobacterota bacterium]
MFNPDDYTSIITVEEVSKKFPNLATLDYTQTSLAQELIKLNYEVVSSAYSDLKYQDIKEYFDIEVDKIV